MIQILFQDASSNPATTLFCQSWVQEFGLTIGVFVDPVATTLAFFDQAETPLNVAIDRNGKAVWMQLGKVDDVEATIRSLLPDAP